MSIRNPLTLSMAFLSVVLLLTPPGTCAAEPAGQVAERLAKTRADLKSEDLAVRKAAIGSLVHSKYLHHDEALVRMKASHALGMIGLPAKSAAPEIVKVLELETDHHRRGYVARALGNTGDPASLEALYTALKNETDAGAQGEMRGAITRLGGKITR